MKNNQLIILSYLLSILLINPSTSKTFEGELEVIIMMDRKLPEFVSEFTPHKFKLTNKLMEVSAKNDFGTPDPNAYEIEYKELKYIFNQVVVKWELYKTILDFKDKTKPFFFPYE
jgi:hypothetical protein